jgi:hypothetical protein
MSNSPHHRAWQEQLRRAQEAAEERKQRAQGRTHGPPKPEPEEEPQQFTVGYTDIGAINRIAGEVHQMVGALVDGRWRPSDEEVTALVQVMDAVRCLQSALESS